METNIEKTEAFGIANDYIEKYGLTKQTSNNIDKAVTFYEKFDRIEGYAWLVVVEYRSLFSSDIEETTYVISEKTKQVEYIIDSNGRYLHPHVVVKTPLIEDEWDLYDDDLKLIIKDWKYGIPSCPELEKVIALPFHEKTNQLIIDYNELRVECFWEKYRLKRFWNSLSEYKQEKNNVFSKILVYVLIHYGYIAQYKYNEEINLDFLENFWNESCVKLVEFNIKDDGLYYVLIPCKNYVEKILDIEIKAVQY